ncbi:putative ribonuclease H-like domain-containing protein [Rosa chinensis]|uniref:Putative ribonuclease H-like domain-containing protein n=1 Tax=Rosa chinensis TaxID=74649 RepID=A0A2P6QEG4_ROSCH|nr:putative ribonuclease H-like domain-containing protein [Rosa chinensis]
MAWFEEYSQVNQATASPDRRGPTSQTLWFPPATGTLKLNVDGEFLSSIQYGGTGGVLRNDQGDFIAAFSYRAESVLSPLHAELLALKYGLDFLHAMNVTKVVMETDCLVAVQAINSSTEDLSELGALIHDIKGLVGVVGDVTVGFTPRQANRVAHRLASYSFDSNIHLDWFGHALEFVLDALMYDHYRI